MKIFIGHSICGESYIEKKYSDIDLKFNCNCYGENEQKMVQFLDGRGIGKDRRICLKCSTEVTMINERK